jgi:hypothetical protein
MSTQRSMPAVTVRGMKDLAKDAIAVQDACNLSGVVHSFSKIMTELRVLAQEQGWSCTDKINRHPVCILFADKIASLTSPGSSINPSEFTQAYNWACDLTRVSKPIG